MTLSDLIKGPPRTPRRSSLFPNQGYRRACIAAERRWVVWFLFIGWWFIPTVLGAAAVWWIAKYTVVAIACICRYLKEVNDGVRPF